MVKPSPKRARRLATHACRFIPRSGWPILKRVTEQTAERALRLFATAYVGAARGRVEILDQDLGLLLASERPGLGA